VFYKQFDKKLKILLRNNVYLAELYQFKQRGPLIMNQHVHHIHGGTEITMEMYTLPQNTIWTSQITKF